MMTTVYRIEYVIGGGKDPVWKLAGVVMNKSWKEALKYYRETNPNRLYRVLKETTVTEVITETIG